MSNSNTDIVGIDLGTTNSVIAVPGHYDDKGQIFGPVTILFDDVERMIHASAICNVDGELLVGEDAKAMAEEGYRVVRFWKKYMGMKETFGLGEKQMSPEGLSALVLKHLVEIAEQRLGIKVKRAVITHPAYFDALAIQATRTAAREAGLDADHTLQMEPVAAAMAYTYQDTRPNVRVLVYDLGGGTFDITLVERTSGSMNPTSFGGDRELGGYNFDKKIATKILVSLREKGYELTFDPDNPQNDPRWTTLLYYAEQIKHKLTDKKKADVRKNGIFKDNSSPPKNVQLSFSMTEPEFRELIKPEIEKTISQTHEVLKKAGHTASDIDYLVMVGGSSRIPMIVERLEEEFGIEPMIDEDVLDLSVAAGAAMMAATSGSSNGGVFLNHIPEAVDEVTLPVSGRVESSEENIKDPSGFIVTVTGGASEEVQAVTGADGGFYVEVELFEESENKLTIVVESPSGDEVFRETYTVSHDEDREPPPPPPPPSLPKPICVATVHGLVEVAPEGVTLPFTATEGFRTKVELTEIPIEIFQQDVQLSTLLIKDFPQPVPAMSDVDLVVQINTDYSMHIAAEVPLAGIRKSQDIDIPQPVIPPSDDLKEEFQTLKMKYISDLENTPDGPTKARLDAEVQKIIEEIEELAEDEHPERMQLYMLLKKMSLKARELKAAGSIQPSQQEMNSLFAQARALLTKAESKDESLRAQNMGATLDTLRQRADEAFANVDVATWKQIAERVGDICNELRHSTEPPPELPPPEMLKMIFMQNLSEVQQKFAASQGSLPASRAKQIEQHLTAAGTRLPAVNTNSPDAQRELINVFLQHIEPVNQLLGIKGSGDVLESR